jgi:hypothetical protein
MCQRCKASAPAVCMLVVNRPMIVPARATVNGAPGRIVRASWSGGGGAHAAPRVL